MKWGVVVFPGSNCDEDAVFGIRQATGDAVDLVWHEQTDLVEYDAIVLPGGFSYGDYLRPGAIAQFSPMMAAVQQVAAEGRLVLGICNGFQILAEAGLLPGALLGNSHRQFRCERVDLVVANDSSAFTGAYTRGQTLRVPISHGDGRYYVDDAVQGHLFDQDKVAFTYQDNPNGSVANIAGVLNEQGNVLGLMPHPERAVAQWMMSTDGRGLFTSMHQYVEQGGGLRSTTQGGRRFAAASQSDESPTSRRDANVTKEGTHAGY